ncbi:MAG TPA: MaoC/PaaZ C-terminal domain-containing protein [bacterium]
MPINYDKLMQMKSPDIEHHYTQRDTMLYALGLGVGADPMDAQQLKFVYEEGLQPLPTYPVVLPHGGGMRSSEMGINYTMVVHGEQSLTIHKLPPIEGTVISRSRITGVFDKGKDKGALILSEREVTDKATGAKIATLGSTTFARGDGGFGGPSGPTPEPHPIPTTAPDVTCDLPTLPQSALIYRLSGDYNPLHADPKVGTKAGFPRPILHGLCTYGVAGLAVLKTLCAYDPSRLKAFQVRFSSPVFPGETIRTEMWKHGNVVSVRAKVLERNIVVLNNGRAEIVP